MRRFNMLLFYKASRISNNANGKRKPEAVKTSSFKQTETKNKLEKKIAKKYTKPYNALRTIVSANEIQFLHKIKQNISANTLTPFI